jgi:hypothetical protein
MSFRQRTTKPSVALWMLVAVGDIALILASFGMVALIALAGVVTTAVGVVGAWRLRPSVPAREVARAPMTARRRA